MDNDINNLKQRIEELESANSNLISKYGDAWYDGYISAQKDQAELNKQRFSDPMSNCNCEMPETIDDLYSEKEVREMSEQAESEREAKLSTK